ncbi:MAG: hypothetical protein K2P70_04730 [Hyphomonadaceae bacterium]|nr:hypothetical protein [Hyphomonadaceae bacterium]
MRPLTWRGAFGRTVRLVEQRLALARLSPNIRVAYRKGDINLDVSRAFSINDDVSVQERVFRQLAKPVTRAPSVQSALTAGRIPVHDRLARSAVAEANEAAAGRVVCNLFEPDFVLLLYALGTNIESVVPGEGRPRRSGAPFGRPASRECNRQFGCPGAAFQCVRPCAPAGRNRFTRAKVRLAPPQYSRRTRAARSLDRSARLAGLVTISVRRLRPSLVQSEF